MKLPGIKVFYSPLCANCPEAKRIAREVAEEEEIGLEEINILSPQGEKTGREYEVEGVPLVLVNEKYRISGIPDKAELLKLIKKDTI